MNREREVRNGNVRAEEVSGFVERLSAQDSAEEGETEAASGRLFYVLFLSDPVSASDREGHCYMQPVFLC